MKRAKKKKENGKKRGNLFIGNNLMSNDFVNIMKNTNEHTNSASAKSFRYSEIIVSGRYELSYSLKKIQCEENYEQKQSMFIYIMVILKTSDNAKEKIHSSFLYRVNMRDLGYFSKHYQKFEEKNKI